MSEPVGSTLVEFVSAALPDEVMDRCRTPRHRWKLPFGFAGFVTSAAILVLGSLFASGCPGVTQNACTSDRDCFQGEFCNSDGACETIPGLDPTAADGSSGSDATGSSDSNDETGSGKEDGGVQIEDAGDDGPADGDESPDSVGDTDGTDDADSETCTPEPETCNGIDDDCDGTVDEGAEEVVLAEDFEGDDPLGWQKVPANHDRLKIDDDATEGTVVEGSEYGMASFESGTCESVSGMGASKSISGDVDAITMQLRVDVGAWGRAALFVRDSAGDTTAIWSANAKGGGFSTDGWEKMSFDRSAGSKRTTSSGAVVETKPIPSGLGDETVWLIFGNNDDSSSCQNGDHNWTTRVDDVKVIDRCD